MPKTLLEELRTALGRSGTLGDALGGMARDALRLATAGAEELIDHYVARHVYAERYLDWLRETRPGLQCVNREEARRRAQQDLDAFNQKPEKPE